MKEALDFLTCYGVENPPKPLVRMLLKVLGEIDGLPWPVVDCFPLFNIVLSWHINGFGPPNVRLTYSLRSGHLRWFIELANFYDYYRCKADEETPFLILSYLSKVAKANKEQSNGLVY